MGIFFLIVINSNIYSVGSLVIIPVLVHWCINCVLSGKLIRFYDLVIYMHVNHLLDLLDNMIFSIKLVQQLNLSVHPKLYDCLFQ